MKCIQTPNMTSMTANMAPKCRRSLKERAKVAPMTPRCAWKEAYLKSLSASRMRVLTAAVCQATKEAAQALDRPCTEAQRGTGPAEPGPGARVLLSGSTGGRAARAASRLCSCSQCTTQVPTAALRAAQVPQSSRKLRLQAWDNTAQVQEEGSAELRLL